MAEASDFKFGTHLGFAKAHLKITPIGKSGHGLVLGELPKILRFHFNASGFHVNRRALELEPKTK